MKKNWLFATLILLLFNACKENKPGMVLSSMVVFDSSEKKFDTTTFVSSNGKLTSIRDKYQVIDSLTYDGNGRLIGYKWQEPLTNKTISKCSVKYLNDTVTKTEMPVAYTGDQMVTLYRMDKSLPVKKFIQRGETNDTTIYTYNKDGDLIKTAEIIYFNKRPFRQEVDITYASDCYQPFSTLGGQLFWELIYQSPAFGVRKLQTSNGVLAKMTVIEKREGFPLKAAVEEVIEPQKPIRRKSSVQFFYTEL